MYCDFSNIYFSSEGCLHIEEQVEVLWVGSFQNEWGGTENYKV